MGLFDVIRGSVANVGALAEKISALEKERAKIVSTPPHVDDLVAWCNRRIDSAKANFETMLGHNLNDAAVAQWEPQKFDEHPGLNPLAVAPFRGDHALSPVPLFEAAAHPDSLLAFIGPAVKEMLPAFIAKQCPASRTGLRSADRKTKLAAIDAKLVTLRTERDALAGELDRAAKAIRGPAFTDAESKHAAEAQAALEAGNFVNLHEGN